MRWIVVLSLASVLVSTAAAAPTADLKLLEGGYQVQAFDQCGYQGPAPGGPRSTRPRRAQINDAECSPGGIFGDYVYLAEDALNQDFDVWGAVERVDFGGNSDLFYGGPFTDTDLRASNLSFTPAGWRGGDLLLLSVNQVFGSGSFGSSYLHAVDATGDRVGTLALTLGAPIRDSAVDPSGSFDADVFFEEERYTHPADPNASRPAAIFRIDAAGNLIPFADLHRTEMRFGPGGDWGTDLYVDGLTIAPNGSASAFATPFNEFTWAAGAGFDGDMFAYVTGETADVIFRVRPDGTRTPFASGVTGQLTGCGGALWIASDKGCLVVTRRGRR